MNYRFCYRMFIPRTHTLDLPDLTSRGVGGPLQRVSLRLLHRST